MLKTFVLVNARTREQILVEDAPVSPAGAIKRAMGGTAWSQLQVGDHLIVTDDLYDEGTRRVDSSER